MLHAAYINQALDGYIKVLEKEGAAGLAYLNARVPHRFTGVYQLDRGMMRNVFLHDKQGQVVPDFLKAVPLSESLCQFVLRDGGFATANANEEANLQALHMRTSLQAYYGVPLLNNHGELYGTLCHFDMPNFNLSDAEFAFLQKAAQVLPKYLFRARVADAVGG